MALLQCNKVVLWRFGVKPAIDRMDTNSLNALFAYDIDCFILAPEGVPILVSAPLGVYQKPTFRLASASIAKPCSAFSTLQFFVLRFGSVSWLDAARVPPQGVSRIMQRP